LLIPYDESDRGVAQPRSDSLGDVFEIYFADGWDKRNARAKGFSKAISTGFVTDQDLISPEEMLRHPFYTDLLLPADLKWFVGIPFQVNGKVWSVAAQASPRRGPFLSGDIEKLQSVRNEIATAARRVAALGIQRVGLVEKTFAAADRGFVRLDWSGKIVATNERAEVLLRDANIVRGKRLQSDDPFLNERLMNLVTDAVAHRGPAPLAMQGPIRVPLPNQQVLLIDAIPMPREFRSLLGGASAIVTLQQVNRPSAANLDLRVKFNLTNRECELALHISAGRSATMAAEIMGLSVSTARQHLKSILAKTGTHRQAELVALLGRSYS
jgi:DNA-binding CsgD family transcriptional regulator